MALFNKFFSPRKTPNKHQQHVSEKQFTFNKDQVRLLLFRECDFRGRKLLFDSKTVEKVVIDKANQTEKFVELSNGYGYMYTKPSSDYSQLSEMVFGSVAMSFRGTYFKIHSLSSPSRLMFTQVFPSPHSSNRKRLSLSSQHSRMSSRSFEHSFKLDDSGQSSTASMCERLSDRSTASDTVLVCRRHQSSPLDVPINSFLGAPGKPADSGCIDHSFNSFSTGPLSSTIWESTFSFKGVSRLSSSSCSLFRRILRSSSRSLEHSGSSLTGSGSTENCHPPRPHCRQSKLGLVFILEISPEQERNITSFFMEHIALIEAMIWRTRTAVEFAYHRPASFVSLMMEIAETSAKWLVDLLTGPRIITNLWQFISTSNICDNNLDSLARVIRNVKSENDTKRTLTTSTSVLLDVKESDKKGLTSSFNGFSLPKLDKPEFFGSFSRFWRTEWNSSGKKSESLSDNSVILEKFLRDFCEVLEAVDIKDTNFFMSTLLTAILTHHLGWVATCLPSTSDTELLCNLKNTYNPLWGQLSDLFGAVGHPAKTAQTVVTGSNKNDVIPRILNVLTYFIRCGNVERKNVERSDIQSENVRAEIICRKNDSIPQENYKKYEDHLQDMLNKEKQSPISSPDCNKNHIFLRQPVLKKNKTQKLLSDLVKEVQEPSKSPSTVSLLKKSPSTTSDQNFERKTTLAKVTSFSDLKQFELSHANATDLNVCEEAEETDSFSNVTFVLGENEELVGIKKESENEEKLPSQTGSLKKRPTSLSLHKEMNGFRTNSLDNSVFKKLPSYEKCFSYDSLTEKNQETENVPVAFKVNEAEQEEEASCSKPFLRSQSEPPEESSSKKFQYSRVKFDLQRYPQVVTNYMKSKNLELGDLPLDGKSIKFGGLSCVPGNVKMDFSAYGSDSEEVETLQTPSNASELEFTSDLGPPEEKKEIAKERSLKYRQNAERVGKEESSNRMKIVNIPMPLTNIQETEKNDEPISYVSTVMKGVVDKYVPDMVLQGTTDPKNEWEFKLKSNLALTSEHSLLDQLVEESVAIVANTDTWEVEIISSHTYVTDKGTSGIRVGMSQLVASMLESLLHMWKLHMPPQYCIMYIEKRLQELCIRSKALAQLLLGTEFCTMELLTSALHLEVNDVPLLLAVASTHTPQVTQKYGLSFQ